MCLTSGGCAYNVHAMNDGMGLRGSGGLDRDASVVLEILKAVDSHEQLTQRDLAKRLGVALGLANAYFRRCVRKGLIKIKHVPANRYLYYLTPKGFAEKSRLTGEYLKYSFDFYRQASSTCAAAFATCRARGGRRALLAGVSELAEIATLRADEQGIELVGLYDPLSPLKKCAGLPVAKSIKECAEFDFCVLTELVRPAERFSELVDVLGTARTVVPGVLAPALMSRGKPSANKP